MTPADMRDEAFRLSKLIDAGVDALRAQARALAVAENEYRKARAEAWLKCPNDPPEVARGRTREWTASRREAWVDAHTADLRMERDIAEGLRRAALEAINARRTQLSALQSLLNAHRAEAEFVRTAP